MIWLALLLVAGALVALTVWYGRRIAELEQALEDLAALQAEEDAAPPAFTQPAWKDGS